MIRCVRVDHRLLHGQVVFTWMRSVNADCILIANDDVVNNDMRKTMLKLTNPAGTKLVFKSIDDSIEAINSGVTDKYNLFILLESIPDAERLTRGCPQIQSVNLGGTKPKENAVTMERVIFCGPEDMECLKVMLSRGVTLECRQVPTDPTVVLTAKILAEKGEKR
ncbi:PTS sugar transporter subunit IIB [Caproiciproducens sp. CPB-2]|uniref:PTS sugar transporter subunit IIB n=1 Tax=Caproiciproducens sp. CPB-2 TaxID=3030017 RepID=UPI0023DCC3F4|nr:PTS sugar transporter subunit IIB [Caproiciproducens sp. CPB-2]MDF1494541.1 PTS sugar transporter subunit IIB [Caproiciproducens sp. CPB-2]